MKSLDPLIGSIKGEALEPNGISDSYCEKGNGSNGGVYPSRNDKGCGAGAVEFRGTGVGFCKLKGGGVLKKSKLLEENIGTTNIVTTKMGADQSGTELSGTETNVTEGELDFDEGMGRELDGDCLCLENANSANDLMVKNLSKELHFSTTIGTREERPGTGKQESSCPNIPISECPYNDIDEGSCNSTDYYCIGTPDLKPNRKHSLNSTESDFDPNFYPQRGSGLRKAPWLGTNKKHNSHKSDSTGCLGFGNLVFGTQYQKKEWERHQRYSNFLIRLDPEAPLSKQLIKNPIPTGRRVMALGHEDRMALRKRYQNKRIESQIEMYRTALELALLRERHNQIVKTKTIQMAVVYKTKFGQSLHIVGSSPSLGEWDVEKAAPLCWTLGHSWVGEITLEIGEGVVEYKYIIKDSNSKVIMWEPGVNHQIDLSEDTCLKKKDRWGFPEVFSP